MPLGMFLYCLSNKNNVYNCKKDLSFIVKPTWIIVILSFSASSGMDLLMNSFWKLQRILQLVEEWKLQYKLNFVIRGEFDYMSSSVSLWVVLLQTISSASRRMRLRIPARSTTITVVTHTARTRSATHTLRTVSNLSPRRSFANSVCPQICHISRFYTNALSMFSTAQHIGWQHPMFEDQLM